MEDIFEGDEEDEFGRRYSSLTGFRHMSEEEQKRHTVRPSHIGKTLNLRDVPYLRWDAESYGGNDIPIFHPQKDHSAVSENGEIEVIFDRIRERFLEKLEKYNTLLGCVAWVTDSWIIHCLENKRVQILVDKPDKGSLFNPTWARQFDRLNCDLRTWEIGDGPITYSGINDEGDTQIDPIRVVGSRRHEYPYPRMHHKFLLFGNYNPADEDRELMDDHWAMRRTFPPDEAHWSPPNLCSLDIEEVWTGSFNLTDNATWGLENVLLIRDRKIIDAYWNEWEQLYCISESVGRHGAEPKPEPRIYTGERMTDYQAGELADAWLEDAREMDRD